MAVGLDESQEEDIASYRGQESQIDFSNGTGKGGARGKNVRIWSVRIFFYVFFRKIVVAGKLKRFIKSHVPRKPTIKWGNCILRNKKGFFLSDC